VHKRSSFRYRLIAASIMMLPWATNAAGLGKMTLLSGLGQPLRAEIDLTSLTPEEFESLTARIASEDAYRQANIQYSAALTGAKLSIEKRSSSSHYVKVSSDKPIIEPFIDILLELSWPGGRLLREYTALVDPPGFGSGEPIAPVAAPQVTASPEASMALTRSPKDETQKQAPAVVESGTPTPAATEAAGASYGPTKQSDRLDKIARQLRPVGISLEQMMVGLYRANSEAFAGNMHRLKTGQILRIPEVEQLSAKSPWEAAKEVDAQAADWQAYRQKLAAAATVHMREDGRSEQSVAGKISAKTDNLASKPQAKETLKLSSGEEGRAGVSAQNRVRALEEEVAAKENAVKEAGVRIAMLEKNVQDMKRLLEFKGQSLPAPTNEATSVKAPTAQTADSASAAGKLSGESKTVDAERMINDSKPAVKEPTQSKPAAQAHPVPGAESSALQNPPATSVAPKPRREAAAKPAMMPALPSEPSLLDEMLGNPLYLGGVGAVLAGLLGLVFVRRKKQIQDDQVEVAGHDVAEVAIEPSQSGAEPSSAMPAELRFEHVPESAEDIDPIAEADVYLAYDRTAQAEQILKDALVKNPDRYELFLKLLEIHAATRDLPEFESVARQLHWATGGESGSAWDKAAALGYALDPNNPLYTGGRPSAQEGAAQEQSIAGVKTAHFADASAFPAETKAGLDFDLESVSKPSAEASDTKLKGESATSSREIDFNLDLASPQENEVPAFAINTHLGEPGSLDFDFSRADFAVSAGGKDVSEDAKIIDFASANQTLSGIDLNFESKGAEAKPVELSIDAASAQIGQEMVASGFILDLEGLQTNSALPVGKKSPNLELEKIDLNLAGAVRSGPTSMDEMQGECWQEVETKLDLARAYQEMGETEGAREILEEVLKEGHAKQQDAARTLLAALG
jgi:pilus assembly protein FimV